MMQNRTSVFNKKVVARFDKKSGILEKEPKRKIYYWGLWRRAYYWWLKEDPIIKNPSEKLITKKPKENPKRTFRSFRTLNNFCFAKKFFLLFDDGYKHSYETFGLRRPGFHTTNHLKIGAKEFSCKSWISCNI